MPRAGEEGSAARWCALPARAALARTERAESGAPILGSSPCPGAGQLLILVDGFSRPNWEVGGAAQSALKVGAANGPLHHRQERGPWRSARALQQVRPGWRPFNEAAWARVLRREIRGERG